MLVLGDAHADDPDNREALLAAYAASDAERALQLGDLLHYDLPTPTWFVAGNNEDFDRIESLRAGDPAGTSNLTLLASDTATVEGVSVGGLSGNHAPTRYERDRDALVGDRRRHFVRDDVDRAAALDADVLLFHEAPHGLVEYETYDPGCRHVDRIVETVDPELCLVGHHHTHAEMSFDGVPVVSLAPAWESYYELDPETLSLSRYETPV
ncbi:MAG: metallophosphoesterase [Halolamina sp.]